MNSKTKGTITVLLSFFMWGLFPIYWKQITVANSFEILAHRIVWSFAFLVILIAFQKRWKEVTSVLHWRELGPYLITAILIGCNWMVYLWAVTHARMVEASLGYFVTPLINVLLGIVFLGERLKKAQFFSLLLAFVGVLFLAIDYGRIPWVALGLSFMFGFYGLIRKTSKAKSIPGLFIETMILSTFALIFLLSLHIKGNGALINSGFSQSSYLIGGGIITAIPLILYNYGTKLIKYSTVGFYQYIAPTMQLIVGVAIYNEPFTQKNVLSFSLIWIALIIYSISNLSNKKDRVINSVST